jgi:hypothetical protein
MKQQIERFSPHQNAKVFAVLMAVGSLVFLVPFFIFASFAAPAEQAPPAWLFLLFPVIYLVLGYIMVAVGCALYNFMYRYIGGIEYTAKSDAA